MVLAYVGKKIAQIAHMAKMCVFDAVGGIFCGQKWFLELPTICPNCPKLPTIMRDGVEHTPTNAPTNTPTSCVYGLQMPLQMGGAMPYNRAVPTVSPCRVMVDVVTNLPRLVGVGTSGDVVAIMRLTCWLLH